jgi:hypothetical protein
MMMMSVFELDQHAYLDLYCARSLNQQFVGRNVAPLLTHYPDSEPTNLCSFSLMSGSVLVEEAANTNLIVFGLTPG